MTLPEVESRVGLTRGDASAMNQPRSRTTPLEAFSGLTKDLADASFEIVKQRQSASLYREMSDMKLRQDARITELSQNAAPGDSLVELGMNEFVKEANEFIDKQPSYMRDKAREKMIMLRDSTASNLLSLEVSLAAEKIALDTQVFSTNLANQVQFGQISESNALSLAKEYVENSVNGRAQGKALMDLTDMVKTAHLSRLTSQNPQSAINAINSGKYNDVNPNTLSGFKARAESAIKSAAAERIRKANAVGKLWGKDNALFAIDGAALLGKELSNDDEIIKFQTDSGIPLSDVSLIPEDVAKDIIYRSGDLLKTVDGYDSFVKNIMVKYPNPNHAEIVLNDLMKHGGLDGPAVEIFDTLRRAKGEGDRPLTDTEEKNISTLIQLQQSKVTDTTGAYKNQFGNNDSDLNKFTEKYNETFTAALAQQKLPSTDLQEHRNQMTGVYMQARLNGENHKEATKIATASYENVTWYDNGKLYLPDDIPFNTEKINTPRNNMGTGEIVGAGLIYGREILETKNNLVDIVLNNFSPETYPAPPKFGGDSELYEEALLRDGYWINGDKLNNEGKEYIVFMHDGSAVQRIVTDSKGNKTLEKITPTFDDLRILFGENQ